MSWSGFKKNVGRATTQVMMKTGHVEKTNDRGFEVEERRYRTLESASLRLQKEAKGYLDSLRAMTASQMRIAETIDAFYGDSGVEDGVSRSYKGAVEDLDAETVKALDGPFRSVERPLSEAEEEERRVFRRSLLKDKSLEPCLFDESGLLDKDLLQEIEDEYFAFNSAKDDPRKQHMVEVVDQHDESFELIDYLYRTTVLEPINRFCAYFGDINECIKKRNHKMLDYDSMRSKVRRLTEKPDKDASKLPRAEKEADMVSLSDFLAPTRMPSHNSLAPTKDAKAAKAGRGGAEDSEEDTTQLEVPSPPKALERPEILEVKQNAPLHRSGSRRLSGWNLFAALTGTPDADAGPASLHQPSRRASVASTLVASPSESETVPGEDSSCYVDGAASTSTEKLLAAKPTSPTSPRPSSFTATTTSTHHQPLHTLMGTIPTTPLVEQRCIRSPFFNPSDLEEFMAPLKREFIRQQTDLCIQAKAAYEQLNEQLSTELPQLIDLRVPYLDPSFEALVKIQLRFCAEAYSRMAQVQQYLDPQTRDQYANGELDARVEDVLGQIRELSIAGTV